MTQRFAGKVLLTTGGGSGLAAAVARRFSHEGGRVAVLDMDAGRASAVAAELPGSISLAVDVASEDGVRDAVASTHKQLGRIDCVFNAAGHADFGMVEKGLWSASTACSACILAAPFWSAKTSCP